MPMRCRSPMADAISMSVRMSVRMFTCRSKLLLEFAARSGALSTSGEPIDAASASEASTWYRGGEITWNAVSI